MADAPNKSSSLDTFDNLQFLIHPMYLYHSQSRKGDYLVESSGSPLLASNIQHGKVQHAFRNRRRIGYDVVGNEEPAIGCHGFGDMC